MSDFLPASPDTIAETPPAFAPRRTRVPRWKADLALIGNTFVWGATFVLVKNALDDSSTVLFLMMRFALAGFALALFARGSAPLKSVWRASVLVGSALFLGYVFQTWGLLYTTPSKSAFITGLSIPLVPLFAGLGYRRFAGWGAMAGVALATAGLYLLTSPSGGTGINRGDVLTMVCAISFAVHIILIGHYSGLVPARALAAGQVIVACLLAAAAVPWAEPVRFRPTAGLAVAIVVTALLATALAFFVQTWAQQFTTPTHTALIFSVEPLFALLASWVLLGETLPAGGWLGGGLILAGILAAELFPRRG